MHSRKSLRQAKLLPACRHRFHCIGTGLNAQVRPAALRLQQAGPGCGLQRLGTAHSQQAQRGMAHRPADTGRQMVAGGVGKQHRHMVQLCCCPQLTHAGMQHGCWCSKLTQLCQPGARGQCWKRFRAEFGRANAEDVQAAARQRLADRRRQVGKLEFPQLGEPRQRLPTHIPVLWRSQRALQQEQPVQRGQAPKAGRQAAVLQLESPQAGQALKCTILLWADSCTDEKQRLQAGEGRYLQTWMGGPVGWCKEGGREGESSGDRQNPNNQGKEWPAVNGIAGSCGAARMLPVVALGPSPMQQPASRVAYTLHTS